MKQSFTRRNFPDHKKDEIVSLIQSRAASVDEVCKEYQLLPHQVFAWIGERTIGAKPAPQPVKQRPAEQPEPSPPPAQVTNSVLAMKLRPVLGEQIDPELARVVGEWWLRTRLPVHLEAEKTSH